MSSPAEPEVWKPVPRHPRYEVSSHGRVRNAATKHVLRPQRHTKGYVKVHLGRHVQQLVHRLVCEAFHGPPPLPTDHADHLDFDPTNNTPSNLRWLSASLNSGRQVRWGPRGWERVCDEEQPDDWQALSDDEREQIDRELGAVSGW